MRFNQFHNVLKDLLALFMISTRIPISKYIIIDPPPDITKAQWSFPLMGALIGFITISVANAFYYIGLNTISSSLLGVITGILVMKPFHQTGLKNILDSFEEKIIKQQKQELSKENKIGTYGISGLIISVFLKVSLLANLLGSPNSFLMIIGSFAIGWTSIVVLRKFSNLTPEQYSKNLFGKPSLKHTLLAIFLGGVWLIPISVSLTLITIFLMFFLTIGIRLLAIKKLGGISEDVLGASVQTVEIVTLILFNVWL